MLPREALNPAGRTPHLPLLADNLPMPALRVLRQREINSLAAIGFQFDEQHWLIDEVDFLNNLRGIHQQANFIAVFFEECPEAAFVDIVRMMAGRQSARVVIDNPTGYQKMHALTIKSAINRLMQHLSCLPLRVELDEDGYNRPLVGWLMRSLKSGNRAGDDH